MSDDDEEGDGGFGGLYENGHWVWDDSVEALIFISDRPAQATETIVIPAKAPTGTVEFRDDVDVIEQIRFRRRYQRKLNIGESDVITLQDVKDIALYTAPVTIMSPSLINMLHLPTTERFIRALTLYCQYYLQIADEMSHRILEQEVKVRTPMADVVEAEFRDNLCDLRLLVAKEYCIMIIGGADTKNYHHMGSQKKRRSLSDKDARLFETLLRMCVQIVWLALGRKAFNQIELEMNRILKSEIFNSVEHTLHTNYLAKMTKNERFVLLGKCMRHDQKLNTQSPLMNEVKCPRKVDYRAVGLGVIKYPKITARLRYMLLAVAGPEEELEKLGVTVGIIGLSRARFDTMLHPLFLTQRPSISSASTNKSKASTLSNVGGAYKRIFPDIVLPEKDPKFDDYFPMEFPDISDSPAKCNEVQRARWQNRLVRLLMPSTRVSQ